MSDAMQYIRKCKLVVSAGGSGLDLSTLRIVFKVRKEDAETPNTAEIRVYNLAEDTANRIKKEFDHVTLEAGYESNNGVIFDGNIKQVLRGRESGTDTFVDIIAGDGDEAYNYATVNKTLAAGSTQKQQIDVAAGEMGSKGVERGYTAQMQDKPLPRGKAMYGMARDYLRRSAQTTETTWSVQDGKLQFVKLTETLPGQAVVLTSKTGLIGSPEMDDEGMRVQCLLNPMLKIGGKVKIDEGSIQQARLPNTEEKADANKAPSINADGIYRLLTVEHSGDTRGNEWYSNLTCIDVNASAPAGQKVKK